MERRQLNEASNETRYWPALPPWRLIAGTVFASAQEPGKDQNGVHGKPPHAATQQMNKGPAAGKMGQNAHEQNRTEGKMSRSAQDQTRKAGPDAQKLGQRTDLNRSKEMNRSDKTAKTNSQMERRNEGAMARHEGTKARATAQEQGRTHHENTAQERQHTACRTPRAAAQWLSGPAGQCLGHEGARSTTSSAPRSGTTVIGGRGAPRVGNVNFDVTVGTVIPRDSIHVVPVPGTLVRIEPAWRGFLYFVYQDEVVIVGPRDMRIVAVVTA